MSNGKKHLNKSKTILIVIIILILIALALAVPVVLSKKLKLPEFEHISKEAESTLIYDK